MPAEINGLSSIFQSSNPAIKGAYVYSIGNQAGVVASNNWISVFNPSGSGRVLVFGSAFTSSEAVAGSTNSEPMNIFRTTAASAGTLVAASDITKFQTTMPNSIAEVRTGNPTVTLGSQISNSAPSVGNQVTTIIQGVVPPVGAPIFTMVPGEGIVFRTIAGDVDQRWNMSFVWSEI